MSYRVTNSMVSDRVLYDLQSRYAELAKTQTEISTGRSVNAPSDDPVAAAQERLRQSELSGIKSSQSSVQGTQTRLTAMESSMEGIRSVLSRANELAIKGANSSNSQADRNAIADELDQLIKSVKDSVNAKVDDDYVFSGTKTDTAPYAVAGADTYLGDTAAVARQIGPGVSVQVNVTGQSLLGDGQAAGDGKLLDVLRDISDHLKSGVVADANTLRTTDLKNLDLNLDALSQARATVGATTNRLESADSRLQEVEGSLTKLLSDVEDADMAKTYTDFSMQQSVYQSALQAGANIVQQSLLDFLQ
jgi:flagellar hook-associated protein 3 FlgL